MHELATCTIRADGGAIVDGYVREFAGDVLMVRAEHIVRGFEAGQDVTIAVLDEVRGECLYAGFVTRVGAGGVDVADVELVSTLQKREVARVRVSLPYLGTLQRRARGAVTSLDEAREAAADGHGATFPDDDEDDDAAGGRGEAGPTSGAAAAGAPAGATSGPVRFTLLDISAHGMRILTQTTIAPGLIVQFRFGEVDDPFVIDAVVVRAQESRTGTHYGCRFVGLSPRQTDLLFRYVMKTQGAQRRERLGG